MDCGGEGLGVVVADVAAVVGHVVIVGVINDPPLLFSQLRGKSAGF